MAYGIKIGGLSFNTKKAGTFLGDMFTGGAYSKKHAAQAAARAQLAAQDKAQAASEAGQAEAQSYLTPYEDVGGENYRNLASMITGGKFDIDPNQYLSNIQMDPGYQFRQQQGERAIQRNMAAGGYSGSGALQKALIDYNQGQASQEYGSAFNRQLQTLNAYRTNLADRYNRLSDLTGIGRETAVQRGNIAMNKGINAANFATNRGNIQSQKANAMGEAAGALPSMIGKAGATAIGTYFGGPSGGAAANRAYGGQDAYSYNAPAGNFVPQTGNTGDLSELIGLA